MESVQWNFDVKVYEIDSFFYVFVYAQISFLYHIHKTYFTLYFTLDDVYKVKAVFSLCLSF